MQKYTVIAGTESVGKTSLLGVLKALRDDLGYISDASCEPEGIFEHTAKDMITSGMDITHETTLTAEFTEEIFKLAKEGNVHISMYYIGLDTLEEAVTRRIRSPKGKRRAPYERMVKHFKERFERLLKVLPYCDEIYLFDNWNGFDYIAKYEKGEMVYRGRYLPKWFETLISLM